MKLVFRILKRLVDVEAFSVAAHFMSLLSLPMMYMMICGYMPTDENSVKAMKVYIIYAALLELIAFTMRMVRGVKAWKEAGLSFSLRLDDEDI